MSTSSSRSPVSGSTASRRRPRWKQKSLPCTRYAGRPSSESSFVVCGRPSASSSRSAIVAMTRTVPACEDGRVSTRAATTLDRAPIAELTEREQRRLDERTQGSRALYERARRALSGGVASADQAPEAWAVYLSHGRGSHVWDVDGTEMVDFHNGFGSMVQGHAHPAIVEAVQKRVELGTHFAAPTEDGVAVAEELSRRFGLPRWRFLNSGSAATVEAIRIAQIGNAH